MSSTRTYLIVACLFILATCVENGLSIKCWECSSQSHGRCAESFDNSTDAIHITDCDQIGERDHLPGVRASMCRRIRQRVNGEWRYIRSCAYTYEPVIDGDERPCLMRTGAKDLLMEYCICNKDGCNSSTVASPKIVFVYVAMIISLSFRFLI